MEKKICVKCHKEKRVRRINGLTYLVELVPKGVNQHIKYNEIIEHRCSG